MRKSLNTLMVAMTFAIFFWPSICSANEPPGAEHHNGFEPINEHEYLTARKDICRYNIFPQVLTGDNAIKDELISKVMEIDDDARYIDSLPMVSDWFSYEISEINYEDTPIYMLEFTTPIDCFCYLATKTTDGTLSISGVKMDSAPIVISKNGYIACFKESNDAYYIRTTIYTLSLDKTTGNVSIIKLGTFSPATDCRLVCSEHQHPVFWHAGTLYIEGIEFEENFDSIRGNDKEFPNYYKLVINNQ